MRFPLRLFLINVILSLFVCPQFEAIANQVIVAGDEWLFSDQAFVQNPQAATALATNIVTLFGGSHYLILQDNSVDPFGSSFRALLVSQGVEVTVNPAAFSVLLLDSYDVVFLAGSQGSGAANVAILNEFIQSGGKVYLGLGTGAFANAGAQAQAWNPFLNSWGLQAGSEYFPSGHVLNIPLSPSQHPLRAGVSNVTWGFGQEISEFNKANRATTVFTGEFGGTVGNRGVIGIATDISSSTIAHSHPYHTSYTGTGTPPWNRLDTNKVLVKEGNEPQLLTYDNLINTAQGINGIVFDIENLPDAGNLSVEDFEFKVSPQGAFDAGSNPPTNWPSAPAPSSITVTPGSPDRVLIQWPDQSIMNRWLRITVLANEETGLAEPETYYISHLLGETTGPENGVFTVSFADITPIRAEVGQTVDASSISDIDKNGTVSFADISAMRGNVGSQLTQINVP